MGKTFAFLEYDREDGRVRKEEERVTVMIHLIQTTPFLLLKMSSTK